MISEAKREALRLFAEGLDLYRNSEFKSALKKFEQTLEADPADGPSRTFITRCKKYIKTPPPEGWDGVHDMDSK